MIGGHMLGLNQPIIGGISSPRVTTADQLKALIEQGTDIPYASATSSGATQINFKKASLKLEVTPQRRSGAISPSMN